MTSLRYQLRERCLAKIDAGILSAKTSIEEARAAQAGDTKSSAGDKYETTREMMSQEIEKHSSMIDTLLLERNHLLAMPLDERTNTVQPGSIVYTNHGNFYLGASIGILFLNESKFQTVSVASPIAQQMINLKPGQQFLLQNKEYIIEKIL